MSTEHTIKHILMKQRAETDLEEFDLYLRNINRLYNTHFKTDSFIIV